MEQTLDQVMGEHFLRVEASESLAQVVDKLRDFECVAAVYSDGDDWKMVSAEILPDLLLKGGELLQQPVSALAQSLHTISPKAPVSGLHRALGQKSWVGYQKGGELVGLFNWASWARYTAAHRVASPYLFSPEWGREEAPLAKV